MNISPLNALSPTLKEFAIDLQTTFEKTEIDFRPWCTITFGTIKVKGTTHSPKIVVKTIRRGGRITDEKAAQRAYREINAWVTLAKSPTGCENINRFLGVADFGHEWGVATSIVTELVRHGSLEYSQGRSFSVKLGIVQQLANGLRHMHSTNLVHGDIKPDNFRINEDGVVKIIDLGLSRCQADYRTGLTTTIEPSFRFIAPELIREGAQRVSMAVTTATDVYAFSMTALQILDGQGSKKSMPFNHCSSPCDVQSAVLNQDWPRETKYSGVKPQAWKVISRCWTSIRSRRPSMDKILEDLLAIKL